MRGPILALVLAATVPSCAADAGAGRIISVPGDAPTIQAAVDSAQAGDIVLVEPGVYRESVSITRRGVTLRGAERNGVVLDGNLELVNGITATADGVAIENLTVRRYQQNAILITGTSGYGGSESVLDGYRVSYVTTYNNGLYGVYAFGATNGVIEHSYASGHPSSGFYVGQCKPCNALLVDLVAENNAIGYYGTNASGDVWVIESTFRGNRLGVAPNSQDTERLAPQSETIVAGNVVADNDNPGAPEVPEGYIGVGIAVGGGQRNVVVRNLVTGHAGAGIALVPMGRYLPEGNRVEDNVLRDNVIDLAHSTASGDPAGNCFAGNRFTRSLPESIESVLPCSGAGAVRAATLTLPESPKGPAYADVVAPGAQPEMPNPRTAPRATVGRPTFPALDSIRLPG